MISQEEMWGNLSFKKLFGIG
ncbi:hypothetical protein XAC3612_690001 [Xanthomonas citri pv. citri]|nr:hypothetical protein XAC3612_690001 [Xanthomonas citri pv. citri]